MRKFILAFFAVTVPSLGLAAPTISSPSVSNDSTYVYYQFNYTLSSSTGVFFRVFVDTGPTATTGYQISGIGADFLVENGSIYKYSGTGGTNWGWTGTGQSAVFSSANGMASFKIPRSTLGLGAAGAKASVTMNVSDSTGTAMLSAPIAQTMSDINLYGPNLNTNGSNVMFAGTCVAGLTIAVSGADNTNILPSAPNGCSSAGTFFYWTNPQSSDGTRTYTFSQNGGSVTGTWVRDTSSAVYSKRVSTLEANTSFPKLAKIAYLSPTNFDANLKTLSKFHLVMLNMTPGWNSPTYGNGLRGAALAIKAHRPSAIVSNYSILNEANPNLTSGDALYPIPAKATSQNWWLRNTAGQLQQWSGNTYGTYEVNVTGWTAADSNGMRWPQFVANWYYTNEFKNAPEIDMWYLDNVWYREPIDYADWMLNGTNQDNTLASYEAGKSQTLSIVHAYRQGNVDEWTKIRQLDPNVLLLPNANAFNETSSLTYAEYLNQVEGSLLECTVGQSWSIENQGWNNMMKLLRSAISAEKGPKAQVFSLCMNDTTNYQQLRYSLASAMMLDGVYFDASQHDNYGVIPWFDEFDQNLGTAVDASPTSPNLSGKDANANPVTIYKRAFSYGMAIVNPLSTAVTVSIPTGYKHFSGSQAPTVNNGQAVTTLTLQPKDGVLLLKQ